MRAPPQADTRCAATPTVWAWGPGELGQLGNGGTDTSLIPVQVSGLTDVTAIASGSSTGYALRTDGTVWACGAGSGGQWGDGGTTEAMSPVQVPGLTDVTAIGSASETGYAVTH